MNAKLCLSWFTNLWFHHIIRTRECVDKLFFKCVMSPINEMRDPYKKMYNKISSSFITKLSNINIIIRHES